VFQSIRIAINRELEILENFLNTFIDYLSSRGKIVIISYHSLEDRLVKQAFKKLNKEGAINILTKKPVIPSKEEISKNSRSRSAKLRAAEKI
jgi:16S rRNA (cytosine1402-N4)-methyltransferase